MAYIFRQKISLDLHRLAALKHRVVLVVEPEVYLAGVYARHLAENDFEVVLCHNLSEVAAHMAATQPHLCLINPQVGQGLQAALKLLKTLKNNFPQVPLATIAFNLSGEEIKNLMEAGVVSHIDRRLTRPGDLAGIANVLTAGYTFSNN